MTYGSISDCITGTNTNAITLGDMYTSGTVGTSTTTWESPQSLSFDVNGETIEFSGQELVRLKEMLTNFIREEHPEDLL